MVTVNSELARTYVDKIVLKGMKEDLKANICLCYFPYESHYKEAEKSLHPKEQEYFSLLKYEKRKKSYLIGRYSAKKAILAYSNEDMLESISIQPGIFNQPVITSSNKSNIQVSITHCDDLGAAIAFPEAMPMGIDIEKVGPKVRDIIATQVTENEKRFILALPYSTDEAYTMFWTAKESISKILKTGMTTPFHIFEINKVEDRGNYIISRFKHFAQYITASFKLGEYICSITYPRNADVDINIQDLKKIFGPF